MAEYTWFTTSVPEGLPVKQVYGIAFSADNRVILRIEDGKHKLTGGKPENAETFEETLKREYIEELNVELEDIHYLGYLLVNDNSDRYAQVRMIAKIKSIHDCHADPATGKIYGRELVPVDRIKEYLKYSDQAGNEMIDDAVRLAEEIYTENGAYKMIRKAETRDLARIAEIQVFNYRLNFYPIFRNDEYYFAELQVPSLMRSYEAELDSLYVYDDGVIKGFIKIEGTYIARLFVEPVLQNASIGSRLLEYAVNEHHADHLWVLEKNIKAIRFYKRNGFMVTDERKPEEGTTEYLILLRKNI